MKKTTLSISVMMATMLIAMLTVAPVTASERAGKTKQDFTASMQVATIVSPAGAEGVIAGVFDSTFDPRGGSRESHGAVEAVLRTVAQPDPANFDLEGKFRWYFPEGTLKGTGTGTTTVQQSGAASNTTNVTINGGSGTLRGATGKLSVTCSWANGVGLRGTPADCQVTGTVRLP